MVNQQFIYRVYFNLWWILSLYYIVRKNLNCTNRETLLLGSIASISVPIVNGIKSGSWLWNNFMSGKMDLFVVDFLWLVIGVITIIYLMKIKTFNATKVEVKKTLPKKAIKNLDGHGS